MPKIDISRLPNPIYNIKNEQPLRIHAKGLWFWPGHQGSLGNKQQIRFVPQDWESARSPVPYQRWWLPQTQRPLGAPKKSSFYHTHFQFLEKFIACNT